MPLVFPGTLLSARTMFTPLAQILRMNGYNTAAYGKSHETPGWEILPTGPFDRCRPSVDLRSSTVLSVAT